MVATPSASTVSLIPPGTTCSGVIGSTSPFTSVPPATQPAGGDATFNLADAPGLVAFNLASWSDVIEFSNAAATGGSIVADAEGVGSSACRFRPIRKHSRSAGDPDRGRQPISQPTRLRSDMQGPPARYPATVRARYAKFRSQPEPSTMAVLGLGLAAVLVGGLRKGVIGR